MQRICQVFKSGNILGNGRCLFLTGENKDVPLRHSYYFCQRAFTSQSSDNDGSDNKTDKDTEKQSENSSEQSPKSIRSKDAKAKLQNLLNSIVNDSKKATETMPSEGSINLKLAKPRRKRPEELAEKTQKTPEEIETEKDLGKEIVQAVKKVAESVEGDSQVVESELVQKLKTQVGKKVNLSDLFAGMKIDRTPRREGTTTSSVDVDLSRARRVRRLLDDSKSRLGARADDQRLDRTRPPMQRPRRSFPSSSAAYTPIDLFGAPPLGIFVSSEAKSIKATPTSPVPKLTTWDALDARDLKLSVSHPPSNGFEEMILWTEQGKLWRFPIDNEQGLDEEANVPFHEHVFLEPQIEGWCPKKGPIRHFMELVCIGLSKNPFLTVQEKHTQIEWYHQYFKKKASVVKGTGAGEIL